MKDLQYIQVADTNMLSMYFNDGRLYELYDLCFNTAPYFEDLKGNDVCKMFEEYLKNGILYLCLDDEKTVGFIATMPLLCKKDVYEVVKEHLVDASKYWYHADIGTHPQYRRMGIAKILFQTMLAKIPSSHIVMRTHEKNEASISLHSGFGFKRLTLADGTPIIQDVHQLRKAGHIEPDRRIFLIYEK